MAKRSLDRKGKLIVIDGSDGVGKATQTALLIQRLKKEGVTVRALDFPQYKANLFGRLLRECLDGVRGDFIALDAHIASVLYAADRFEAKPKLEKWLREGCIVVLDRYVSANQLHQGGKIRNDKQRKLFLKWLDTMEHGIFGLPRPDVVVYLHLPTELSLALIHKRGRKDLAERNVAYLSHARESALKLIKSNANWVKIVCAAKGSILPKETIHDMVWAGVKKAVRI